MKVTCQWYTFSTDSKNNVQLLEIQNKNNSVLVCNYKFTGVLFDSLSKCKIQHLMIAWYGKINILLNLPYRTID